MEKKFRMHILEDPSELSARAQDFLRRSARRECPSRFGLPIELWQVRDQAGKLVPAPMELIIRCEGFEQKFGGLRYEVRRSWVVNGERYETARGGEYDHLGLQTAAWQAPGRGGWYFEWTGERVSKPCRDLIHSDGSVGTDIDGGSPYLRIAPSLPHLIESHALTDTVATWKPWPMDSLASPAIELLDGLVEVPEASWGSHGGGCRTPLPSWTTTAGTTRTRAVGCSSGLAKKQVTVEYRKSLTDGTKAL
ncbi:hypothetical protein [Streptomyces sp. NPDC059072]|uniref:hypothetical protein n=1 Tax=Streptomyces sp. NPDC059072 TaxID=3346715 RepID=UPI003678B93F